MTTLTAVFDGNCVICNTTRRIVNALDWFNRVTWLNLHDRAEIEARYPTLDYDRSMGEIHVIDDNGAIFAGFDGTRRMLRALPLGIPLWAILRLPLIGDWLGPRVYRFIARNRYSINRLLGVDLETLNNEDADCVDGVCKMPNMPVKKQSSK